MPDTPDASGGFTRASGAFQEDFALYGALDERELVVGKFDVFHPSIFLWYNKSVTRETQNVSEMR